MASEKALLRKCVKVCKKGEKVGDVDMTRYRGQTPNGNNSCRAIEIVHIICLLMFERVNDVVRKIEL